MTQIIERAAVRPRYDVARDRVVAGSNETDGARVASGTFEPAPSARQRYLLALRFAVVNLAAFALLGAAYVQGWVTTALEADSTGLSVAIFGVFLGGLAICIHKVWAISCELNCVRNFDPCRRSWAATYLAEVAGRGSGSRAITASALRVRISSRIVAVRHVANSLVLLGLIGTVLGFIIALAGVDPNTVGEPQSIAPMVGNLIRGMSVALYTTLVGAVLNLWLTVDYRILAGGAAKLATDLISLGEANARDRLL
ncbi:MAG: MotA/TolQ/ExbB proton channel family protein [Kiloniellaceae bacterium]